MIYRFVRKENDVTRIGAIDAEELEKKLAEYLASGHVLATAEEHDAQVIGALNRKISELLGAS